jgi:hypothetical protein
MIRGYSCRRNALYASRRVNTSPEVMALLTGGYVGLGKIIQTRHGSDQLMHGPHGATMWLSEYRRATTTEDRLKRVVTLQLSRDYTMLGDGATRVDLDQYGRTLAALLENEFDVQVHVVYGCSCRSDSDDAECRARIREIESGDEWIQLL